MTDNMIERVARALRSIPWEWSEPLNAHDDADIIARAAIEAMREPTNAMLEYSGEMEGYYGIEGHADRDHIAWWNTMIDAALQEKPE